MRLRGRVQGDRRDPAGHLLCTRRSTGDHRRVSSRSFHRGAPRVRRRETSIPLLDHGQYGPCLDLRPAHVQRTTPCPAGAAIRCSIFMASSTSTTWPCADAVARSRRRRAAPCRAWARAGSPAATCSRVRAAGRSGVSRHADRATESTWIAPSRSGRRRSGAARPRSRSTTRDGRGADQARARRSRSARRPSRGDPVGDLASSAKAVRCGCDTHVAPPARQPAGTVAAAAAAPPGGRERPARDPAAGRAPAPRAAASAAQSSAAPGRAGDRRRLTSRKPVWVSPARNARWRRTLSRRSRLVTGPWIRAPPARWRACSPPRRARAVRDDLGEHRVVVDADLQPSHAGVQPQAVRHGRERGVRRGPRSGAAAPLCGRKSRAGSSA